MVFKVRGGRKEIILPPGDECPSALTLCAGYQKSFWLPANERENVVAGGTVHPYCPERPDGAGSGEDCGPIPAAAGKMEDVRGIALSWLARGV